MIFLVITLLLIFILFISSLENFFMVSSFKSQFSSEISVIHMVIKPLFFHYIHKIFSFLIQVRYLSLSLFLPLSLFTMKEHIIVFYLINFLNFFCFSWIWTLNFSLYILIIFLYCVFIMDYNSILPQLIFAILVL